MNSKTPLEDGHSNTIKTNKNEPFYRVVGTGRDVYYTTPTTTSALSTATMIANLMTLIPIAFPSKTTIDRVCINVTNVGGMASVSPIKMRLGIYTDSGNGSPQNLFKDLGEISTTSIGVKSISTYTDLEYGLYWFAFHTPDTPTVISATNPGLLSVLGISNTLPTSLDTGYTYVYNYGVLPQTVVGTISSATTTPLVFVRIYGTF